MGNALYATGDDDGAAGAYRAAAAVILGMADSLSPVHRKTFLAAPPVDETLKAGN